MYQYNFPWAGDFGVNTKEAVDYLESERSRHLKLLTDEHVAELTKQILELERQHSELSKSIDLVEQAITGLTHAIKIDRSNLYIAQSYLKKAKVFRDAALEKRNRLLLLLEQIRGRFQVYRCRAREAKPVEEVT